MLVRANRTHVIEMICEIFPYCYGKTPILDVDTQSIVWTYVRLTYLRYWDMRELLGWAGHCYD